MVIDIAPVPAEAPAPPDPSEEPAPSPQRVGPPAPGLVTIALSAVMVLGVVTVFFGLFAFGLSGLQEERSQHLLYAQFRGLVNPSSPVAPRVGGAIPAGTPVALVDVPRIGLHDVVIVEGTSSGVLLAGPGHLRSSPLPGQVGQSVIVGKSTTAGAPFASLGELRRGDAITVRTGQGKFDYVVRGLVPAGERPPPVRGGGSALLLTTSGSVGSGGVTPSHLIYVDAVLHGKAVPVPAHQPRTVATSELPGHSDPGSWPLFAGWLAAVIAGTAATWWLWARWRLLRTWLIAAPILLGLLWGLSNAGMRFLPNTY